MLEVHPPVSVTFSATLVVTVVKILTPHVSLRILRVVRLVMIHVVLIFSRGV